MMIRSVGTRLRGIGATFALSLTMATGASLGAQTLPPTVLARLGRADSIRMRQPSVSVRLDGTPTLPLVAAYVNGRGPFSLLIDAGSALVILKKSVLTAANVRTIVRRDKKDRDIVEADSIRIGDALFIGVVSGEYEQLDVDGVIGLKLFGDHTVSLDFPNSRLTVSSDTLPSPSSTGVEVYRLEENGLPMIRVHSSAGDGEWLLDTGAAGGFALPTRSLGMMQLAAPLVDAWPTWNNQRGISHQRAGRSAQTFSMGGVDIPQPIFTVDSTLPYPQIGMRVLQRFRIDLDLLHQRVRFTPLRKDPIMLSGLKTSGVNVAWQNGRWQVVDVVPVSPVARDISVGDIVSAINGIEVHKALGEFERSDDVNRFPVGHELWRAVNQPAADTLSVQVSRGGVSATKRIPLIVIP